MLPSTVMLFMLNQSLTHCPNFGDHRHHQRVCDGDLGDILPTRRKDISKPGGGDRMLGIPTVLERFIGQAIMQILTPIFDPHFSEYSYGFRPGRSALQAITQAQSYIQDGYRWVVGLDLEKFFDRVNHDILMSRIARRIDDKRLLKLIRRYLEAGIMSGGVVEQHRDGTPQGSPLSPLLSNILWMNLIRN